MKHDDTPETASGSAAKVSESVGNIGRDLRDLGSSVKHAAAEECEHLRERTEDYFDRGRERARDFERGIEGYIQEQPLKSVLIATGVGLLIGILWRRR